MTLRGPRILVDTLSVPTGKGQRLWQYHSRSDAHSKIACWTLLFDLLLECDALRDAARQGRLGFGINYEMVGPINKTLDLVVTWLDGSSARQTGRTLADLASVYALQLSDSDREALYSLPALAEDLEGNASEVVIAIEAKACMTEHLKSLPRLHAEILATGYLARLAARQCITVSYTLVNAATVFDSPSGATTKRNQHQQPENARRVVDMIDKAIPISAKVQDIGYDVVGVTVVDCRNDGSPITLVDDPAMAPTTRDRLHYERMVRNVCSEFRARFRT
jgi:hypothetical protein